MISRDYPTIWGNSDPIGRFRIDTALNVVYVVFIPSPWPLSLINRNRS